MRSLFAKLPAQHGQCDNYNPKWHKYVSITTHQPDTKYNPNPNPNRNPTTKQHAVVNIQLNIVTCPTYPNKFIRDNVVAQLCYFRLYLSHCPPHAYTI